MNANLYAHFPFTTSSSAPFVKLPDGKQYTYADIDRRSAQYCHFFAQRGFRQGDRLLHQVEKSVDAFCLYLASLRYGLVYIPLNPAFQQEEMAYFLADAQPAFIVCPQKKAAMVSSLISQKKINTVLEILNADSTSALSLQIDDKPEQFSTTVCHENDIACMLYTSGTTGKPKGAMLSHKNLLANGKALQTAWEFTETDVLLHALPIFHCHGLFFACHSVLLSGASMIFLPKFTVEAILEHLPASSVFMGVPTYYTRLLAENTFSAPLVRHMRLFLSGSAPLPPTVFHAFATRTEKPLIERYGMTETGINTSNPLHGKQVPGSVGLPLPPTQVRIVDEQDKAVALGNTGHLQVKGASIFSGYWRQTEKTKQAFTIDGFFRTGDIGIQTNDGYVTLVGRASDMIISGGINIYPKEIEILIDKIPGVKESAIIGLPHADLGEAVTAIIVMMQGFKLDAETVIISLKQQLAHYKVPKKVIFIDELPKNVMGKVQKNVLRQTYSEAYLCNNK